MNMKCSSLNILTSFGLRSILSDIRIATPLCFQDPFWIPVFILFTLRQSVFCDMYFLAFCCGLFLLVYVFWLRNWDHLYSQYLKLCTYSCHFIFVVLDFFSSHPLLCKYYHSSFFPLWTHGSICFSFQSKGLLKVSSLEIAQ